MTKIGTLRLRSVRMKSGGGEIRVMHGPTAQSDARHVSGRIERLIEVHDQRIAGFAIVVWAPSGASTALTSVNEASKVPAIMVPDFVRNRLLADTIERWVRDDV